MKITYVNLVTLGPVALTVNTIKIAFQNDVKELKKKLRSNEDALKTIEIENYKFLLTMKEVQAKITTAIGGKNETKKAAPFCR